MTQAQVEAAARAFIAPYDAVTNDTLHSFVAKFPNNIHIVMAMSITPHSAQAILDFRSALSASPPAPQPASQDTTQYGWVIEGAWSAAQTIEYWTGGPLWSQDHMNAIRFARREDADRAAFMMLDGMNVRVVEHGWDQSHALQPASQWRDIASLPEGQHVLLYLPNGERGVGGMETAMVFKDGDGWSYWTHGGPNSGSDFELVEKPTHYQPLPAPPESTR